MRFTLSYKSRTTPNHDIWITTCYGRDFSLLELLSEIYKIKVSRRMWGTKDLRIRIARPDPRIENAKKYAKFHGEDTYTLDEADCDICSQCGEHSSMAYDIETDEQLGTSCCGAGHYDTDYDLYER